MINSNFGFTPLREVWLGDCYPESFYDHLPNKIADPLRQITQWTKEDTGRLQKFLESRGIVVRRPVFTSIDNHLKANGTLSKPPVTPRDNYLVLDKTLYSLHNTLKVDPWNHWLDYYQQQGCDIQIPKDQPINCLSPPALVRLGKDIIIDTESHKHVWGHVCECLINQFGRKYRVNISNTNGHSDGVFCPVSPGLIVSTHYKTDYSQSFPGWKVFKIPDNLNNFGHSKNWLANDISIDRNKSFDQHIQTVAQDWVGNFKETVFEVNMLVLDQKNVVAMKDYPPLTKWLNEHGISVHFFNLRTRSFWDGGWHCFTLDINREDTPEDLFPNRGENGVFWRIN